MKPQRDIPGPWAEKMLGLEFEYQGRPSVRALAERAGVTPNAALRVIHRENFGEATVVALGMALQDSAFVAEWVGLPAGDTYTPPVEARRLTPKQRNLVDELIRELATGEQDVRPVTDPEKMSDLGSDVGDDEPELYVPSDQPATTKSRRPRV